MGIPKLVNRISYALFVVSLAASVVLGLLLIWGGLEDKVWGKVLGSSVVVAIGCGLLVSVTQTLLDKSDKQK